MGRDRAREGGRPCGPGPRTGYGPRRLPVLLVVVALVAANGWPFVPPVAVAQTAEAERSREELSTLRKRISELERQVRRDTKRHGRAQAELREVETAAADSRRELDSLRRRQERVTRERDALAARMDGERARLDAQKEALARQLRATWMQGSAEPLRLMLGQDDYARLSRLMTWSGYMARRREALLATVAESLAAIARSEAELARSAEMLAGLERQQALELAALEERRRERAAVLAKLEREQQGRDDALTRARREAEDLARLLKQLERVATRAPDPGPARALLPPGRWPVEGRLLAGFGQRRAGGTLKWDGVLIAAPAGTPVKAAREGRVIYADWLPGLGLLLVMDHGGGYMSLYGHNQSLLRRVGERVPAGEVIAEVGDSGGRGESALYFEVRRNGRPENPDRWLR